MFELSIIALDKKIFQGRVVSLTIPGSDGELTILKNHISLIVSLKAGKINIKTEKEEHNFPINGGILEVRPEKVVVLATP